MSSCEWTCRAAARCGRYSRVPSPYSWCQREAFLRHRNERDEVIAQRLAAAPAELAAIAEFDHVVLNVFGGLDAAATDVLSIVEAERARRGRGTSAS